MHVYKLINLCTCVCRSYTSGCRQNAEEEEKKGGEGGRERRGKRQGSGDKERIRRGFRGRTGKRGKKRGARKKKTHGSI